jgi:hypothetical protein
MAIDQGTSTVTTKKEDRCWRVEMFIDEDLTQQLVFHREVRAKDATTNEILARDRSSIQPTRRVTDEVKTKSYTASGLTATGQQILALVNKMADVERQVDLDTPPPAGPQAVQQTAPKPNAKAR